MELKKPLVKWKKVNLGVSFGGIKFFFTLVFLWKLCALHEYLTFTDDCPKAVTCVVFEIRIFDKMLAFAWFLRVSTSILIIFYYSLPKSSKDICLLICKYVKFATFVFSCFGMFEIIVLHTYF